MLQRLEPTTLARQVRVSATVCSTQVWVRRLPPSQADSLQGLPAQALPLPQPGCQAMQCQRCRISSLCQSWAEEAFQSHWCSPWGLLAPQGFLPQELQALRGAEAVVGSPLLEKQVCGFPVEAESLGLQVGAHRTTLARALIRCDSWAGRREECGGKQQIISII